MNPTVLCSVRFGIALAVWSLVGGTDAAEARVAAIDREGLAAPSIALWDAAPRWGLDPEGHDRPPAKGSVRKGPRRGSQARPLARSSPGARLFPIAAIKLGRPPHEPTVRLAAAANLPWFCRWLL